MPQWDIVEDPNIVEFSYSTMKPAQELDVDPELAYEYDETDKLLDPVDLSQFGHKSRADKMKLMDINDIPNDFDWEYTQNCLKTDKWATFRYSPEIYYKFAHFRREQKIRYRNEGEPQLPSLWAYFETMPSWATNNPFIRAILMGLEVREFA